MLSFLKTQWIKPLGRLLMVACLVCSAVLTIPSAEAKKVEESVCFLLLKEALKKSP